MTMSVPERKSGSEGKEEESEDESEILEESPCGRWQKRKEQYQNNVNSWLDTGCLKHTEATRCHICGDELGRYVPPTFPELLRRVQTFNKGINRRA